MSATPKHFAGYSLEEAEGEMRFGFNAVINAHDMEDTYLVSFRAAVLQASLRVFMCSCVRVGRWAFACCDRVLYVCDCCVRHEFQCPGCF